ncbi:HAMP domain-containing protein [Streptomyces sp. TBY4]|uniref:HAMP domain-containing protein n=1 Tax=Streptomyces sp. TBY4 TaxID=2962030 RepID=UPI0027E4BCD1|nr:HAMP domain-containing protein [Streptomyces sp. TBY4]
MSASRTKRRQKARRRADMSLLGGIRPPIAALSALLLALAALTAFHLGKVANESVPEAVRTSQQYFAEDGAIAMRASLDESITDISRTATLFNAGSPVSADTVLDKLGNVYQKWRGTAVIEVKSGRLEAQRGENVPLTAIDHTKLAEANGLVPRMVRLENGETRLLTFAVLSWPGQPQKLLVASSSLRFPGVSLGKFRAIAVTDSAGHVLSSDGLANDEQIQSDDVKEETERARNQLKKYAKIAARKTKVNPLTTKEPGSGGFRGVSGSLLGPSADGERTVVGYASLTGPEAGKGTPATALGLTVISLVNVTEDSTAVVDSFFGIAAAAVLLVIGLLAVSLLIGTVQKPLLQLFLESRRLSRGDLNRPVNRPKYGEAARIGTALERLRRQLRGEPAEAQKAHRPGRGRGRIGARALLATCGALLLLWSAPLVLLLNRAGESVPVPQTLVHDQRERTDTMADRVRRALNEGHADLTSVGSLIGPATTPAEITGILERTLTQHQRYESLYVLQEDGTVMAKVGAPPRRPNGKVPVDEPVVLVESGNSPVIIEFAAAPGLKGASVVGELRIDFLNSLLKRPGLGEIRVIDEKQRVIAGNNGYLAFQQLPNESIRALAAGANQKVGKGPRPSSVLLRGSNDDVTIAAAIPMVGGGAAKPLTWTVVSWQPAKGLAIPEYNLQNRTVLAGLLGLTAALVCLGWLHIVVIRALRELAARAEALADGDRRTVLYPRHHDEVGAVTRSLEVIRQQLQELRKREASGTAGRSGQAAKAGRN